ncbi:hypothetical protein N8778_02565 [Verrucomicrobia bacterium]|nr:hypothetical protein [Verrucomicrobiota bacterium]
MIFRFQIHGIQILIVQLPALLSGCIFNRSAYTGWTGKVRANDPSGLW